MSLKSSPTWDREEARKNTIEIWKARWSQRERNNEKKLGKTFGRVRCQLHSEHSCFNQYLYRFQRSPDDKCIFCSDVVLVENNFFACSRCYKKSQHENRKDPYSSQYSWSKTGIRRSLDEYKWNSQKKKS